VARKRYSYQAIDIVYFKEVQYMEERQGAVTFMGNPLTLLGPEIRPGDKAPDFTVVITI
jgi:hypothetical protein